MKKQLLILGMLLSFISPVRAEEATTGSFWHLKDESDKVVLENPLPKSVIHQKGWLYLNDGRVCKGCTYYKNLEANDEPAIVVDKRGYLYRGYGAHLIGFATHPYARMYAQGLALGAMQMGQTMQQNAASQQRNLMMQQYAAPKNWNCNSFGNSTSCQGY